MMMAMRSSRTIAFQVWVNLSAVPDRVKRIPAGRPSPLSLSMTPVFNVSSATSRGTFSGGRISRVTVRARSRCLISVGPAVTRIFGERTRRHDGSRRRHDRQVVDALGLDDVFLGSAQGEVDALAVDRDLGDAQAVIEGVHGIAQFTRRNAVIGKLDPIGHDADFRRP